MLARARKELICCARFQRKSVNGFIWLMTKKKRLKGMNRKERANVRNTLEGDSKCITLRMTSTWWNKWWNLSLFFESLCYSTWTHTHTRWTDAIPINNASLSLAKNVYCFCKLALFEVFGFWGLMRSLNLHQDFCELLSDNVYCKKKTCYLNTTLIKYNSCVIASL